MRNRYLGVMIATIIALGTVSFAQSNPVKIGKTGHFTLKRETRVGDAVLPVGDYEVRHRRSANGHFIEFTRVTEDPTAEAQTLSPYDWEVVAEVPCTMQSLKEPATTTYVALSGGTDGHLNSLKIRGESVVHVFQAGPDASAPQNQVEYGGGGM